MPVIMIKSDARARQKPCLRCGYSLRKLADAKHCPECGLSVWLSLNPNDTLDWSNPQWLKKLSHATAVLVLAQLVGLAAYVAWAVAWMRPRDTWVFPPGAGRGLAYMPPVPPPSANYTVAILLISVHLIGYGVGLLLLSTGEGRHPDRWKTYRWACAGIGGVGIFVGLIAMLHGSGAIHVPAAATLIKASLVASGIATWAYLRKLAQRVPQSALARLSGYLMLLPMVPLLAILKFVPFFAIFAVLEIYNLLDFLPLAYVPVSAVLFVWYARLFRRAAANAEAGWKFETASSEPRPAG